MPDTGTPYQNTSEVVRHALYRHLQWLGRLGVPLSESTGKTMQDIIAGKTMPVPTRETVDARTLKDIIIGVEAVTNTGTGAPTDLVPEGPKAIDVDCTKVWSKWSFPPPTVIARCFPGALEVFGNPPSSRRYPGGLVPFQAARTQYYEQIAKFAHAINPDEDLDRAAARALGNILPLILEYGFSGLLIWQDKANIRRCVIQGLVDYYCRFDALLWGGSLKQTLTTAQAKMIEAGHPIDSRFYTLSSFMPGRLRRLNEELLATKLSEDIDGQ